MEGIVTLETNTVSSSINEANSAVDNKQAFANNVQNALRQYFTQLDGAEPANLYNLVLAEMEIPLLKMVVRFTRGNQSKAAKILGISRGTLRKKLAMHSLN